MPTFKQIKLFNWRQFESVNIDLEHQVTVLTGQNGSGKTTILNILARHFGWNINFISTPYISKNKNKKIWSDVLKNNRQETNEDTNSKIDVGYIKYDNEVVCSLKTSTFVSAQYQLQYQKQQQVIGLHIPSHRPSITYHSINEIPTNPKTIENQYQEFKQLLFQTYGSNASQNPGIALKRSLISLALFGYGNNVVVENSEFRELFESFQEVLKKVLPKQLGFQKLEIRMPEVVLITDTGEFSLDSMSGGINDLFGLAWQIHMYGYGKDSCTVLIDEPENHLHPSMQRSLLPSLAHAFSKYRIIVATHSPFIVSSMPDANVYGLIYNNNSKVESVELTETDLSGTPNKILKDILDVPSNLPIWVENKVHEVIQSTEGLEGEERTNKIIEELDKLGLTDQIENLPDNFLE